MSSGSLINRVFSRGSDKEKKMPLRDSRHVQDRRRSLKTYDLKAPDYKIDPQTLIDSYIEKEIKYLGQIPHITADLDPKRRTEILRVIDSGKKQGLVAHTSHEAERDAILSISAHNVKILRRDGEELLFRVPIHEIASLSYVRDDGQHLIACKVASDEASRLEEFKLLVLQCQHKAAAEEICSLLSQTFEVVYTELTMSYLDISIIRGDRYPSLRSHYSMPRSSLDDRLWSPNNGHSRRPSEGDLSIVAKQMLQEYIELLRKKLTSEELQRFASILREYREGMPVNDFCTQLQTLYGQERMLALFPGLKHFIPEKDGPYFDNFLERHGISDGNGHYHNPGRFYTHSVSETSSSTLGAAENGVYSHSIPSEMDEFDKMLHEICMDVDNLESSIDN
ncbi:cerebral cavernous malformations protein 2 homolog isoform X2 [Glandiceps talaboti]